MRTSAQTLGDDAESMIAARLAASGWTILGRNLRFGRGEIDLLAIDPDPAPTLVIVEVRWRRSRAFGVAEETIDHRKRAHLRTAVARLLRDGPPASAVPIPSAPVRVDLIVVEPAIRPGDAVRIRHHRAIEL